jgi:hypothetical protein
MQQTTELWVKSSMAGKLRSSTNFTFQDEPGRSKGVEGAPGRGEGDGGDEKAGDEPWATELTKPTGWMGTESANLPAI